MDTKILIEAFGYLGSALVVVSMLMTSVLHLRIINMIGSIIFAIYALIIRSYPTALMNFFLVGINLYHLTKLRGAVSGNYTLTEVKPDDRFLEQMISNNQADIDHYFPDYAKQEKEGARAFIIMHNNEVAGFTVGMPVEDSALELCLDYSTPAYRDCSVGKFLYEELKHRGIRRFIYTGSQPDHMEYLKKVGFTETKDGSYELK